MKAEVRANEIYPNNTTFCGGVAQIARQAYVKGWEEVERELLPMLKELTEAVLFDWENKEEIARQVAIHLKER
jgi:hypothetical protein